LLRADTVVGAIDPATLARVVAQPETLAVAGRLDRSSRGLLLLTQDGTVARQLVGGNRVEKHYLVRTTEAVTDSQLAKLRGPLRLDDQPLRPMRVELVEPSLLGFVLVEGRKHQLRRVCRHVGLHVVDLLRTAIGPFSIAGLPERGWRLVTTDEVHRLMRYCPSSVTP
jgi:23S rRNA pseudouridine2604 synthase